jgi:hypothetical protein
VALLEDLDLFGVADLEHDERLGPVEALEQRLLAAVPRARGIDEQGAAGDGSVHPAQLDLGAMLRNAEHGTLRSLANSRPPGPARDP